MFRTISYFSEQIRQKLAEDKASSSKKDKKKGAKREALDSDQSDDKEYSSSSDSEGQRFTCLFALCTCDI